LYPGRTRIRAVSSPSLNLASAGDHAEAPLLPVLVRSNQGARDALDEIDIYGVAECLECPGGAGRKVPQGVHALQASALPRSHVSLLPPNDRHLCRCHGDERRSRRRPLESDARGAELDDEAPDVPRLSLAVPFELLKTRGEP